MSQLIKLSPPLTDEDVAKLKIGDRVLITGKILTGRDSAHKRLFDLARNGKPLPIEIKGQIIYYVGPAPAKPGKIIGSAGPTTSYRMDPYTPLLLKLGLKAMIGKGQRNSEVREAIKKYKAVYLAATGGAGALISRCIKSARIIAYEDLGPEAIRELIVEEFPAIVANDIYGGDLYDEGIKKFKI